MEFNSLDTRTQLQLIINDLSSCHVMGNDALKYGSALKALGFVMEKLSKCEEKDGEA